MNPVSTRQTQVRVAFADWSQGWRALTNAQRDAWTVLGAQMERTDSLGQTYTLTGLQAYVSANQNLLTISATEISAAPLLNEPPAPPAITPSVDTDPADVMTIGYTPGAAADFLVVEASAPVSAGRSFMPRSGYKLIGSVEFDTASPFDILTAYEAIYGEFPQGSRIFFRAKVIDSATGQSSPWVYANALAA